MSYKFANNLLGEQVAIIKTISKEVDSETGNYSDVTLQIPIDPANTDYQEYLAWKAIDGNEPEAAD
tara:strand:+ start:2479 stop:2676 length:198 start_codon:yes stop_codon:yes gene_type:complete